MKICWESHVYVLLDPLVDTTETTVRIGGVADGSPRIDKHNGLFNSDDHKKR